MNDTLSIKKLLTAQIGTAQLDSTPLSFPRVMSSDSQARRQNLSIDSLSPTILRVSHVARSSKSNVQRSIVAIDQKLTRKDALSNPVGDTNFKVAFQCDIPSDITLAEFRAAVATLFGFLLEADAAMVTSVFNGEY